jgi:hypothetical protein
MRIHVGMIALLASACTGDIGSDPGDGSGSNPPPPPPATDVRVTVQDGFMPQAGVRVLYQNADGSTFQELTTDATGTVDIDFPSGNITVIRTFPIAAPPATPRPAAVYTYVGVKAGDRLVLGDEMETNATALSAVNVSVPTNAQGTVSLTSGCGNGQGQAPLVPISVAGCPAMVTFYGQDQGGSSFLQRVAYGNPVDLSTAQLANNLTTSFSSTNVGPDIQNISVEASIVDGTYALWSSGAQNITNNPQNVDMPNVTGADELLVTMVQATGGSEISATRQAYAVTPTSIDATSLVALPYVKTVTYAPTGVSWAEEGSGTADFVIARLDVTAASTANYERIIVAPHSGMSLPLPMLQGADAMYNPSAADQIAGTHAIGKATGGYDAARTRVFAVTSLAQTAPMSGNVTLSYSGNAPTLGPN